MVASGSTDGALEPPDPSRAVTLDEVAEGLRLLKVWAGGPSFEEIKSRINREWKAAGRAARDVARKSTVADCFKTGRRRINADLVVAVVQALHPDPGYVAQWRQALRVIAGETQAAAQVRVEDKLPADLPCFIGRTFELGRLQGALRKSEPGQPLVVITGPAGVGKTRLAVHVGHLLTSEATVDRVLFVNLRGFHSDRTKPPADPAAVLDGFLRLLGVAGHQIPHGLAARTAAYRARLAGTRTLVVLDNAANDGQVGPLLPETVGCPVVVTSRRRLTALQQAIPLSVDVFAPSEAITLLTRIGTPLGPDPTAPDRIDQRRAERRLEPGVETTLDLSYRHLPADRQRLLRQVSLHPGQELTTHAAAALAGDALPPPRPS